ncbi:hypothetical protein H6S82_10565 [Planktothrix sp. FACHB-1355]|uniref:Uncharacterized protein n=1 Tax=Aerosakkonema funiforme FACHB-1375 TaxID=2949571 RepID=A0A926VIR1_9CYAN|nr:MULTISPECIES: hypothetical protein [Oscillatoriales]MBD2184425.1 hypothetical protein [Aerosakkonema funiforme FACHB-1375]MBD3559303.1 hypothetical protein [Planktothrix sp. FACHB-1355]
MSTANDILESDYANAQLDAGEKARLEELEAVIEQGLQTFYEVGKALDEIREKKLYRETHKTFDAYCRDKWGIARRTAYQFIDAAHVMENLCAIAHKIPTKENQVRPLKGLPSELQIQIWQEAVESAPNGIPTGAAVQRLVDRRVSSRTTRRTSGDASEELGQLRLENQRLKEQLRQRDLDRERRAAEVAAELERLREENRQLKAELRQRDIDWERRLAYEREKIREELRAEIREEVKAEYEGQINTLTAQVSSLTQQLAEMTAKYEAVLARLEAIEGKK